MQYYWTRNHNTELICLSFNPFSSDSLAGGCDEDSSTRDPSSLEYPRTPLLLGTEETDPSSTSEMEQVRTTPP